MLQHQGGGPRNALGYRPEPEVLPLPAETSREAPKCCAWQHQGGGAPKRARAPSRSGSAAPASRNEPRLPSEPPGSQVLRLAGPRNALGYRPEPEVLPLPAETSREAPKRVSGTVQSLKCCREAPKCCAWQHQGGGPETRSGTVQSLKCCPCQQKRAARLPLPLPADSIKRGAPKRARVASRA